MPGSALEMALSSQHGSYAAEILAWRTHERKLDLMSESSHQAAEREIRNFTSLISDRLDTCHSKEQE